MMGALHALYRHLPQPGQTMAASIRGAYLNGWRYGRQTPALIDAALERETWSDERWERWRAERTRSILLRAASKVPYYRALWATEEPSLRLADWPILTKQDVRARPHDFVADDRSTRRMFRERTSGTSGTPLTLWWSRTTMLDWFALFDARVRRWNGLSRQDRWAMIGGQLVAPIERTEPPFWVWNAPMRQLYMSSYHLAPRNAVAYVDAMRRKRIRYILGYASSLHSLASFIVEAGLEPPELSVVISNAEPLLAFQRETISRAFGCRVVNTYGMAEIVTAGSECSYGSMHMWPEVGLVEAEGRSAANARFVCTGLINADMPLIRYDTADGGELDLDARCECGRNLPVFARVDGRVDDEIVTPDGRRIGRLDPVFKGSMRIREAQIVQETRTRLRVFVVPVDGYSEADTESIRSGLRDRVGDMDIAVQSIEEIPRDASGKFRAVVNAYREA